MTIVSLNCGYGALGDNADFSWRGTSVYTADKDRVISNLSGIAEALAETDADIIIQVKQFRRISSLFYQLSIQQFKQIFS